jgi:hypothetical protein
MYSLFLDETLTYSGGIHNPGTPEAMHWNFSTKHASSCGYSARYVATCLIIGSNLDALWANV